HGLVPELAQEGGEVLVVGVDVPAAVVESGDEGDPRIEIPPQDFGGVVDQHAGVERPPDAGRRAGKVEKAAYESRGTARGLAGVEQFARWDAILGDDTEPGRFDAAADGGERGV